MTKPKKNPGNWPWRPDLLLTPTRGGVRMVRDVRFGRFGTIPWLTPYFHRPGRRPHIVPPFGLN